MEQTKVY